MRIGLAPSLRRSWRARGSWAVDFLGGRFRGSRVHAPSGFGCPGRKFFRGSGPLPSAEIHRSDKSFRLPPVAELARQNLFSRMPAPQFRAVRTAARGKFPARPAALDDLAHIKNARQHPAQMRGVGHAAARRISKPITASATLTQNNVLPAHGDRDEIRNTGEFVYRSMKTQTRPPDRRLPPKRPQPAASKDWNTSAKSICTTPPMMPLEKYSAKKRPRPRTVSTGRPKK